MTLPERLREVLKEELISEGVVKTVTECIEALKFYKDGHHFYEPEEMWTKPGKIGYDDPPEPPEILDHGTVAEEALAKLDEALRKVEGE